MKKKQSPPLKKIYVGRFSILLISIILLFALHPFLEGFVKIKILTDIFFSLILLSAIYTVSEKRRTFLTGLVLAISYLIFIWSTYLVSVPSVRVLSQLFGAFFTGYILVFILTFIARQQNVTVEVIKAAVCGYFFLGLMWSFIYLFMESYQPGSFQIAQGGTGDQGIFIYFSFITMTTVGYGDTIPVSNAARSLAVLEAVMGQLYLAVTIARLVGIHISQGLQDRNGGV
ncbi:MAG: ion channel [Bacteroidales bacterium]